MTRSIEPRYMPQDWMLPRLSAENRPFFTSGELRLQQCAACGNVQHPPEEVCRACQAMEFNYILASGKGKVESYTIVHHAVNPKLKGIVPYNAAIITLDDYPGVRIVGNVTGAKPADIHIGLPVEVTFALIPAEAGNGETMYLPQWRALGGGK